MRTTSLLQHQIGRTTALIGTMPTPPTTKPLAAPPIGDAHNQNEENASIGGHYRHCLDHFRSFLRALDSNEVDYDHRDRDRRVESDPTFALAQTRQIREALVQIAPIDLGRSVQTRCEISYVHGRSPLTKSTYGREIVYAIPHAIHHYALISIMARLMDLNLPPQFGIAPSTVAYQKAASASAQ
jgi:hypothetical protein